MITAQVAVYPLKTSDASSVINSSVDSIAGEGIDYSVSSLGTLIQGTPTQVWASLETMFETAHTSGEITMVITITNAAG